MSPKFHDNLINVQLKEHIQEVAGKGAGEEGEARDQLATTTTRTLQYSASVTCVIYNSVGN